MIFFLRIEAPELARKKAIVRSKICGNIGVSSVVCVGQLLFMWVLMWSTHRMGIIRASKIGRTIFVLSILGSIMPVSGNEALLRFVLSCFR